MARPKKLPCDRADVQVKVRLTAFQQMALDETAKLCNCSVSQLIQSFAGFLSVVACKDDPDYDPELKEIRDQNLNSIIEFLKEIGLSVAKPEEQKARADIQAIKKAQGKNLAFRASMLRAGVQSKDVQSEEGVKSEFLFRDLEETSAE